jgi:toxin-antitoxin system PIN domain toxin
VTFLLDVNVLVALAWPSHVHHAAADAWFVEDGRKAWATTPVTENGFVRVSSNPRAIDGAVSPATAVALVAEMRRQRGHAFWPADISLADLDPPDLAAVVGHRQVTDAYLLALARRHEGVLVTFDDGLRPLARTPADPALRVLPALVG